MEDFVILMLFLLAIFAAFMVWNLEWYEQGKCEWMYGSGSIYEDGKCFNPITK